MEIQIFHTVIQNFDKTLTILPNNKVLSGAIQNMSTYPIRRIQVKLNIPYSEDIKQVKSIILEAGHSVSILEPDSSFVIIHQLDDHFIRVSGNFFAPLKGYWVTKGAVTEAIIIALREKDIQVAYPTGIMLGKYGKQQMTILN